MTDRRYDMDWIRIAAFVMLILYHCGMFYVTWDWHVKSSRASDAIEPLMLLTNPWRLTLLFLVSGAATRFMADKMSVGQFTWARMGRLWPPLLLAMFVIVPPQTYYEIVEVVQALPADVAAQYAGAVDNFWVRYATGSGNWCGPDGCLTTPTYNHMWFVAYLILYTLALVLLLPLLRRAPKGVAWLIAGPGLLITPWLFLFATRAILYTIYGETHDFRADPYAHTAYFAAFLFGFAIAKYEPFFARCLKWRLPALIAAIVTWLVLIAVNAQYPGEATPPDWMYVLVRGVREMLAWTAIIATVGYAHRYLRNADGPIRQTLTQAIFPFYLIHQTIIVVAGHYLDELRLPIALEGALLVCITALGCWLFFDLGRRVPVLRVWIGLPSKQKEIRAKNIDIVAGEAT
ncbi:acyltransferase family protein [Terricaulis silvestris]|uniref:Glucans biosynthesis protein n=1 Tax=Terricaulis silvestris TaxID=2686094 RepID=A0A6I6MX17_9CAUL|nr:acyltransferase [Terricaulis silvestris]QGZ95743.1 glucans biosynthesis protein [Terricaulis silvestris]